MREGGVAWSRAVAAVLGATELPARRVHPRIKKLLRHLQSLPPDGDSSLEGLAAAVGLSPGRLMHAFTESIGLPVRPYLLWCKLQRGAAGIAAGLPLAQAATRAGFSDAAHMTRAFRRMFGMPPSMLRPAIAR
jgi:AraC-like DNA-binding protein